MIQASVASGAVIEANAWSAELNSYVGYYGGTAADASLLLLARYGYIEASDPRMIGTCRCIERTLGIDGLLYRYPLGPAYDGVGGDENLWSPHTARHTARAHGLWRNSGGRIHDLKRITRSQA